MLPNNIFSFKKDILFLTPKIENCENWHFRTVLRFPESDGAFSGSVFMYRWTHFAPHLFNSRTRTRMKRRFYFFWKVTRANEIFFCVQRSCRRFMNSSKKNIPPDNTLASVPRRQKSPSSALVDTEFFCPISCGFARNVALTTPLWGGIIIFHAQMAAK